MKHIKIILGLVLFASVTTFAQSPRIKLNQITKDTVKGSVLISSPTDSGMVYSRDFYVAYGVDTVLILYGDTLAATSGIISSVLSDGVTITGDGTTGSELTVDTTTVIATKKDLSDYVTIAEAETITGAKTFTNTLTQSNGDVNFDSGTFFVDENSNKVGIGTTSPSATLSIKNASNNNSDNLAQVLTNSEFRLRYRSDDNTELSSLYIGGLGSTRGYLQGVNNAQDAGADISLNPYGGYVGIGTNLPTAYLEVNGNVKISDLTGTGGNAVYENGGVLGVASDARFKTFIADLHNGIEKILNLKPKYFIDNRNSAFQQLGFYAQEVKSVINEASYPIGNTEYLGLNDRAIIAVTVKAIQEQQAIIESIQSKLDAKSSIIDQQATEIEQLKSQIQLILSEIEQIKNN